MWDLVKEDGHGGCGADAWGGVEGRGQREAIGYVVSEIRSVL